MSALSKGSPLPFELKELSPDGRQIIGLYYFKSHIRTFFTLAAIILKNDIFLALYELKYF